METSDFGFFFFFFTEFNVTDSAFCGLGRYNGWIMCLSPRMACGNALNHLWWDQFHPTVAVNEILADNGIVKCLDLLVPYKM